MKFHASHGFHDRLDAKILKKFLSPNIIYNEHIIATTLKPDYGSQVSSNLGNELFERLIGALTGTKAPICNSSVTGGKVTSAPNGQSNSSREVKEAVS